MTNATAHFAAGKNAPGMRLALHSLRVGDPQLSLEFYQNALGMRLLAQHETHTEGGQETHYFLAFTNGSVGWEVVDHNSAATPCAVLELVHQPHHPLPLDAALNTTNNARYWKIGVTLADVDIARARLLAAGVKVSEPKQFLEVGYLCHLYDPDGYCIELLQHDFAQNHQAVVADPAYALGTAPTLGQITLRIGDPQPSLRFYRDLLGMRLLSRQIIEAQQFTLYFLACGDERPPNADIDAVANREWLWQRPYTTLELQQVWRDDWRGLVQPTAADAGFRGIGFAADDLQNLVANLVDAAVEITQPCALDGVLNRTTAIVLDPDGNRVCLHARQ